MSYNEFLSNIDKYVGKVVRFTSRMKATGKVGTFERYVWDNKEFGALREDSLIEILNVEIVRDGKLDTSVAGIIGVR